MGLRQAAESITDLVQMNIEGNRRVVLEGSRGIVEYSESTVRINTGKYILSFQGRNLHIENMNQYDLTICGFITSIEYIM